MGNGTETQATQSIQGDKAHALIGIVSDRDRAYSTTEWKGLSARLLPGALGMLLSHPACAFHIACAVDDAGFSIHPTLFGWQGRTLATVIVFQKPCAGRMGVSVLQTGAGALNIEGGRIPYAGPEDAEQSHKNSLGPVKRYKSSKPIYDGGRQSAGFADTFSGLGRWPTNLFLTHGCGCQAGACEPLCPVRRLDEQSGERPAGRGNGGAAIGGLSPGATIPLRRGKLTPRNDTGGASRFFYQARWENANDHGGEEAYPPDLLTWLATLLLPPAEYAPRRLLALSLTEALGRAAARAGWEQIIRA